MALPRPSGLPSPDVILRLSDVILRLSDVILRLSKDGREITLRSLAAMPILREPQDDTVALRMTRWRSGL